MVLAAWSTFVIAGASFAKFSEHFDEALPHSNGVHRVPDFAFTLLQTVAAVAGVLVVAGALLALPAFVRFLRRDGWTSVRGHCLRAFACTAVTLLFSVPLLIWAHRLTPHQRNGGIHWYGAAFFLWAGLIVLTLLLWTVVAVAAGRRVALSRAILTLEATLAAAVAVAMVVMFGATVVWWGAMANHAPAFLSANPGGAPSSPWDFWLIATVVLMAASMGAGGVGVVREARRWKKMRAGGAMQAPTSR